MRDERSNIEIVSDFNLEKSIPDFLEDIAQEICEHYCKYPEQWDEEKEGCELCESDICQNCPLNRLV